MIKDLIDNKKFNPKAAALAVDNFLATIEYVFKETCELPR